MQSSSFMTYKGQSGVNISIVHPPWLKCPKLEIVTPTFEFIEIHGHTNKPKMGLIAYQLAYIRVILSKINAEEFYSSYQDRVILDYPVKGEPSNRRILADWLEKELGVEIPELSISDPYGNAVDMMEALRNPVGNRKKNAKKRKPGRKLNPSQLSLF